jgi:hypothetical protein
MRPQERKIHKKMAKYCQRRERIAGRKLEGRERKLMKRKKINERRKMTRAVTERYKEKTWKKERERETRNGKV